MCSGASLSDTLGGGDWGPALGIIIQTISRVEHPLTPGSALTRGRLRSLAIVHLLFAELPHPGTRSETVVVR